MKSKTMEVVKAERRTVVTGDWEIMVPGFNACITQEVWVCSLFCGSAAQHGKYRSLLSSVHVSVARRVISHVLNPKMSNVCIRCLV